MHWTMKDNSGQRSILVRHTHKPKKGTCSIRVGRSGNVRHGAKAVSRTNVVIGRAIPAGWVPMSGMKVRNLVVSYNDSAFHR